MNSSQRDVLLALALLIAILFYDIKSGKINIRNSLQNCYRYCSKAKIASQNQEFGIEKKYRLSPTLEKLYIDFDTTHRQGTSALGTAFVIDEKILLSARHVINGCRNSYVLDSKNNAIPIVKTEIQNGTDVALLYIKKPLSPSFFLVDDVDVSGNTEGFHFGFPGNNSGQAYSHFLGQAKVVNSRGYKVDENVLVWSVEKKSSETLAGISGGPVFNQDGNLVGISIGESIRRGRAYTSNPQTNKYTVDTYKIVQNKDNAKKIQVDLKNYENLSKSLYNDNMIVKVICSY
jgi:serine protease Do